MLYLRCQVSPGQFSDERIASFYSNGQLRQMFVPATRIHGDLLEVEECTRDGNNVMVWLPAPMLDAAGSGNHVTVLEQQLVRPTEVFYGV